MEKVKPLHISVQSVLPTVFGDELSYYETLSKVVHLVNELVAVTNNTSDKVEELSKEINELREYIHDYFGSSDFMAIVVDALEEILASGDFDELIKEALEELIAEVTAEMEAIEGRLDKLEKQVFDTVEDMTEADLSVGDVVMTKGYHFVGIGGAYYIVSDTGAGDGIVSILLDNELYANIIPTASMSITQFGCIGSGDETEKIQACVVTAIKTVIFDLENVYVSDDGIELESNKSYYGNMCNVHLIPTEEGSYNIIKINEISNILVDGLIVTGDKSTHLGNTGEWGHCFSVGASSNVTIRNCKGLTGWGDGCYIGGAVPSTNVQIIHCSFDSNRRNGLSVVSANGVFVSDSKFNNNGGTAPHDGIDFETNSASDVLKNIKVVNCVCDENAGFAIQVYSHCDYSDIELVNVFCGSGVQSKFLGHHSKFKADNLTIEADAAQDSLDIGDINTDNSYLFNNVIIDCHKNPVSALAFNWTGNTNNVIMNGLIVRNGTIGRLCRCGDRTKGKNIHIELTIMPDLTITEELYVIPNEDSGDNSVTYKCGYVENKSLAIYGKVIIPDDYAEANISVLYLVDGSMYYIKNNNANAKNLINQTFIGRDGTEANSLTIPAGKTAIIESHTAAGFCNYYIH